jgi:hypothetical protein
MRDQLVAAEIMGRAGVAGRHKVPTCPATAEMIQRGKLARRRHQPDPRRVPGKRRKPGDRLDMICPRCVRYILSGIVLIYCMVKPACIIRAAGP